MLIEIITAIIFGLLIGNYTTTVYHRLPLNKPINGSDFFGLKPHCSKCGHKLKFYEYLPLLSWFATRFKFKCNYCNQQIEMTYFYLEFLTMCASILYAVFLGIEIEYILAVFSTASFLLLVSLYIKHKKFYKYVALLNLIFIISLITIFIS